MTNRDLSCFKALKKALCPADIGQLNSPQNISLKYTDLKAKEHLCVQFEPTIPAYMFYEPQKLAHCVRKNNIQIVFRVFFFFCIL